MKDLNALKVFKDVVSAGGYSAAHRITGQSRATLSRYITELEQSVGARLIERSTRSFRLTEQGQILYDRSLEIFNQLDEAFALVENQQIEPRGLVKIAIPPSLLNFHHFGEEILRYMQTYTQVRISIEATNREIDIHNEGFDFVLRARSSLNYPLDYVPILLAPMQRCLVVHPQWKEHIKETLEETLEYIPTIAWKNTNGSSQWELKTNDDQIRYLRITPRLMVDDMPAMRSAALKGLGIVLIPMVYVEQDIALGRLVKIDLDLSPAESYVHAVHLGQRGMRPAVRHLLDWLKEITIPLR